MISEPSRYYAVELEALPSRIGQIRRIISAHLRHWHLDTLVDQAALGVTELLTNVHRHVEPDKTCTVEIELLLDRLTVSVRDRDPRLPEPARATSAATAAGSVETAGATAVGAVRAALDPLAAFTGFGDAESCDALATSGRGLALVDALSDVWGVRPCGADGKVVWFTLTAPAPPAPVEPRVEVVPLADSTFVSYGRLPGLPLSTPADPLSVPAEPVRTPAAAR
ncbi:ATP-binding protein [Streptomyces sp. NPDC003327]